MSKLIYSCVTGEYVYGLDTPNKTEFMHKHVFIEPEENIVGFRRYNKFFIRDLNIYYELGFFMEMLYEGDIDAFEMLMCPKEYVNFKSEEWDILKENERVFQSLSIIQNMYTKALEFREKMVEEPFSVVTERTTKGKKRLKKLAYNKDFSYLCFRNLYAICNSLRLSKLDFSVKERDILTAIDSGAVHRLETVQKELDKVFNEADELLESTDMDLYPEHDEINKILLRLRKQGITHEV